MNSARRLIWQNIRMKKFYVGHLFQVQIEKPFSFVNVSSSCQQSQITVAVCWSSAC